MTYWLTAWLAACCPLYMIVYTAYLHCRLQQLPRATKIFIGLQATWRQMLLSAQKICENKRRWLIILRRPHSLLCCSLLSPALRTVRMGIATNDWARLISLKVLSLTMDNAEITKHAWKLHLILEIIYSVALVLRQRNSICKRVTIIIDIGLSFLADRTDTQNDQLLASACRPPVCLSVCL